MDGLFTGRAAWVDEACVGVGEGGVGIQPAVNARISRPERSMDRWRKSMLIYNLLLQVKRTRL